MNLKQLIRVREVCDSARSNSSDLHLDCLSAGRFDEAAFNMGEMQLAIAAITDIDTEIAKLSGTL